MSTTAGRWTKIYGHLIDGEALHLSRDARLLGVEAEAWADDNETDGAVPRNALRKVTDADPDVIPSLVDELVALGRWVETATGWEIVGFIDRHGDSDSRAADRASEAARLKGWRAHQKGNHNPDGPKSCAECAVKRSTYSGTNGGTNGVRTQVEAKRSEATAKRRDASGKARSASPSADAPGSAPLAGPVTVTNEETGERFTYDTSLASLPRPVAERAHDEYLAAYEDVPGWATTSDGYLYCGVCGMPVLLRTSDEAVIGDEAVPAHTACLDEYGF